MRKIILLTLLFTLACCAKNGTNNSLINTFEKYRLNANKNNILSDWSHYFDSTVIGNEDINDQEIIDQFLFKSIMKRSINHYEKYDNGFGCLTVNGIDEEDRPIAFNLKYIYNNRNWLISEIHVLFAENSDQLSASAKCPSDYYQ